jgi:hypothetical protein
MPRSISRAIAPSNMYVRAMNGHSFASPNVCARAISSPRSPASRRANGSRKTASSRSLSRAR